MRVQDWMTRVLVTVRPDDPVAQAERLMRYRRIRHLPVLKDGRLIGIITDRDVRTALPSPATSFAAGEVRYLLDRLLVYADDEPTGVLKRALGNLRAFDYERAEATLRTAPDTVRLSLDLHGRNRLGILPPPVKQISVHDMPFSFLARQFPHP